MSRTGIRRSGWDLVTTRALATTEGQTSNVAQNDHWRDLWRRKTATGRRADQRLHARLMSSPAIPGTAGVAGLFSGSATYQRPATAYIALWQILGTDRFTKVLQTIQQTYGGGSITEPQLEAAYLGGLPNKSAACQSLLSQFFTEWFDTADPSGGATKAGHHRTRPGRAWLLRHERP
jgi:hypothetical protein